MTEENTTTNYDYCSPEFQNFFLSLNPKIYTLNLFVCIFGVITNALSIAVYTRKHMVNPTNVLLTAIAVSDLTVLATYIPQYIAVWDTTRKAYPYFTAFVWIFHEYFLAVFHHISIWLTLTLAIWRYIAVVHPFHTKTMCTMRRALIIIAVIVGFNLIITIPGYADARIKEVGENVSSEAGGCAAKYCAKWEGPINTLRKIEFVYQGIISKIIPSFILTFVSIQLALALIEQQHKREKIVGKTIAVSAEAPSTIQEQTGGTNDSSKTAVTHQKNSRDFDKITTMILAILILFLVTELPPSIAILLEVFLKESYYRECRAPAHYLILMMYYISGCFNFFVYFNLNERYRAQVKSFICSLVVKSNEQKFVTERETRTSSY